MAHKLILPCGCYFEYIPSKIRFCPLHAAAPAMLEACKFALMGYQNIIDFNLLPGQYNEDTQKHIDKLSAAIAAAKPVSKEVK